MSTIPQRIQEAILNKSKEQYDNSYIDDMADFERGAGYGYQLATDGREELEKENAALKMKIDEYYKKGNELITALQSQCTEKEKELVEEETHHSDDVRELSKQIEELKAENERLKGLIEKMHTELTTISPVTWLKFKTENNL